MSDDSISQYRATWNEVLKKTQTKDEDAIPSCKGCGHSAYGKPMWMLFRSSRKLMTETTQDGCQICPILLQGVDQIVAENEELRSDEFSLEMTQTGAKTMLVRLLGTIYTVSFYIKKGEYMSFS